MKKKRKKLRIIDKYINLDYFSEYSIISIGRSDWAEEFRVLNQTKIINKKLKSN